MASGIEVSVLIAVIGCFVGLAGWLKGRDARIANDAEWKGAINAKLDGILGIRGEMEDIDNRVREHDRKIAAVESAAALAHTRIDRMGEKS